MNDPQVGRPGVHPSAVVGETARLGKGVTVGALASIGDECVIGNGTLVEEGVMMAAGCLVGPDVIIGMNATILPKLTIGQGVRIGAGSVVTRSIPAYYSVQGNPHKMAALLCPHCGSSVWDQRKPVAAMLYCQSCNQPTNLVPHKQALDTESEQG